MLVTALITAGAIGAAGAGWYFWNAAGAARREAAQETAPALSSAPRNTRPVLALVVIGIAGAAAMALVLWRIDASDDPEKPTTSGLRAGEALEQEHADLSRGRSYRLEYAPKLQDQLRSAGEDVFVKTSGTYDEVLLITVAACGQPWLERLPLGEMMSAGFQTARCEGGGRRVGLSLK